MFEVLEIGGWSKPYAPALFPEETVGQPVKITQLDADPNAPNVDVVHELRYPDNPLPFEDETFDAIIAQHIYEHIPYWQELPCLIDWVRCLKVGGALHISVPSAEFIARQILSEHVTAKIKPYAIGGLTTPWDIHINLFTMPMLRSLFVKAGLDVVIAKTGFRKIDSFGELWEVEQHYIAGIKREKDGE